MMTCMRKTRYDTAGKAMRAARLAAHRTGEIIKHYACADCGGFHIGHLSLKALRRTS